jgi:hypothetical protein
MGEDGNHGAGIDVPCVVLLGEVAVGPVDDPLVRVWEARVCRQDRTSVTDCHVIAEQASDTRQSGREVDGAEHQHAWLGSESPDEDTHAFTSAFTVRAVGQRSAGAGREPAAGIVLDSLVGASGPQ